MAGSLTVQSSVITETAQGNVQAQSKQIGPIVISAAGNISGSQDIALNNGDNAILTPLGATIAVIIVTANPNVATISLRGIAGDTGIGLNASATIPAIITFANPNTANSFHLVTGAVGVTVNISYL